MKLITAVIKSFKLDDVREALSQAGIQGMTVSEVRSFRRQRRDVEIYRRGESEAELESKTKIEMAVPDALAARVVDGVVRAGRAGKPADGTILVRELRRVVRIRTGEQDEGAL